MMRTYNTAVGLICFALAVVLVPTVTSAVTYYVPDDFPCIQCALDDPGVTSGDEIIVRDDGLRPTINENINLNGKNVYLHSENGPDNCTIDGDGAGSVVTCASGETNACIIEGFTVTSGAGTELFADGNTYGGGFLILNSAPTVRRNVVTGNTTAQYGAGAGLLAAGLHLGVERVHVEANEFHENTSSGDAGGVFVGGCDSLVELNLIRDNAAVIGGGGGVLVSGAVPGGEANGCSHVLRNNIVRGNSSGNWSGAGIFCQLSCEAIIVNCVVVNNDSGVAAHYEATPELINSIVTNNTGCGVDVTSSPGPPTVQVSHCDVWGNGGGDYCNMPDQTGLNGNISQPPIFLDWADDFRLRPGSPCIDVGDNSAPWLPPTDYYGDARIINYGGSYGTATVDIGVDETGLLRTGSGWNIVSYDGAAGDRMRLADCLVTNGDATVPWDDAVAAGWVQGAVFAYTPGLGYFVMSSDQGVYNYLLACTGCWLLNQTGGDLGLIFSVPE